MSRSVLQVKLQIIWAQSKAHGTQGLYLDFVLVMGVFSIRMPSPIPYKGTCATLSTVLPGV